MSLHHWSLCLLESFKLHETEIKNLGFKIFHFTLIYNLKTNYCKTLVVANQLLNAKRLSYGIFFRITEIKTVKSTINISTLRPASVFYFSKNIFSVAIYVTVLQSVV